jgi:hypothetical protein
MVRHYFYRTQRMGRTHLVKLGHLVFFAREVFSRSGLEVLQLPRCRALHSEASI